MTTTIIVYSIWKAEDRIEIEDEQEAHEVVRILNAGSLDGVSEEVLDQMTSTGADLTDWSASVVRAA